MKKLLTTCCLVIILFSIICPNNILAQESEEQAIKSQVETYIQLYSNIVESRDKDALLGLCSKDMVSSIYYFGISGNSRVYQSDYKGLESHLNKLLRTEGVELNYELQDIPWIHAKSETGGAVYHVDYEIKEPEGIWVKGKETVTIGFRKIDDEWKIVRLTVLGFDDERLKGTCITELFISEAEDGEVITKTTVPSGQSYNTFFNSFDFANSNNGFVIRSQDDTFSWSRENGNLRLLSRQGVEEQLLGEVDSKRTILLTILEKHLYSKSCSSMKTKK